MIKIPFVERINIKKNQYHIISYVQEAHMTASAITNYKVKNLIVYINYIHYILFIFLFLFFFRILIM